MMSISRWQSMTNRFTIKITLPQLLLGFIAASFGLFDQSSCIARLPDTNIIAITTVMANLQDYQTNNSIHSQFHTNNRSNEGYFKLKHVIIFQYRQVFKIVRLMPNNGIRAGPIFLFSLLV